MMNVKQTITGNKLVLEIDLSKELGESTSGKSIKVASTAGNVAIDPEKHPGVMLGLNVYRKK